MSYKLQRNVYLIFHNRHFLKNARCTQLAHHGIGFLDTAEVACTAQPAGRVERCINGEVGKTLFYIGSHRIGFILGLTGVITGVYLYAVARTLNHFLLVRTGRNVFRTYQSPDTGILMDRYLTLPRHITFQTLYDVILRYRCNVNSKTFNL